MGACFSRSPFVAYLFKVVDVPVVETFSRTPSNFIFLEGGQRRKCCGFTGWKACKSAWAMGNYEEVFISTKSLVGGSGCISLGWGRN